MLENRHATASAPPANRAVTAPRAPATRSAVTNGRRLHVAAPGDGAWARRFRDVLAEIVSDLGGPDRLVRRPTSDCTTLRDARGRMREDRRPRPSRARPSTSKPTANSPTVWAARFSALASNVCRAT